MATTSLPYADADSTLRALSGRAEGIGRFAIGGFNGHVHHVTSLAGKSEGGAHSNSFNSNGLEQLGYNVLKVATGKFYSKNLAGQGGCGDVYKGWLDYQTKDSAKAGCGLQVAIKRIKRQGYQGLDKWKNELKILSSFRNPNVVKLLGYCADGVHRMLVFEFMPMGSLEERIKLNSRFDWYDVLQNVVEK